MSPLRLREISREVRNMKPSEMESLVRQTTQIKTELTQGVRKSYKEVINVCWGDAHQGGIKPLTFVRQVLAACIYPQLDSSDKMPDDVKRRARALLAVCEGRSVGKEDSIGHIVN
ncbi:hypothetical protein DPEC_G00065850 [Dallia pectoralis]|uniref:Uncharacterized protein n=1 Tax=Dallia pectoralis TaxID=75939 RepID=A0ACC2H8S6_DALPE|nr:hypothetical protein DPEC_G00065850 [Dallia pectoralis]